MKEAAIRVLMVEPDKHPVETILNNTLDSLQKAVSVGADSQCLIEAIRVEDGVVIIANEESKVFGLPGNRRYNDDILAGVFYVAGEDDEGNFTSLSDALMEKYKTFFYDPDTISDEEVQSAMGFEILFF